MAKLPRMGFITQISSYIGNFFSSDRFLDLENPLHKQQEIGSVQPLRVDTSNLGTIYKEVGDVSLVIDRFAEMMSNVNWIAKDDKGEMLESHPRIDLLNNPNCLQTKEEFIKQAVINELTFGSGFIRKLKAFDDSEPSALWNINPEGVEIEVTGKFYNQIKIEDIIKCYKFEIGNEKHKFKPSEIWHIKNSSNELLNSTSVIEKQRTSISNNKAAFDARNVLLKEKGAIGIMTFDAKDKGVVMSKGDRREAEKELSTAYSITKKKAQRFLFSFLPTKWQPMSFPTSDLMAHEETEQTFSSLCDSLGMDVSIFSRGNEAKYENKKQGEKSTYQNGIIPKANQYAKKFSEGLEGVTIYADFSHLPILQEDLEKKSKVLLNETKTVSMLVEKGIISQDEAKERIDKLMNNEAY